YVADADPLIIIAQCGHDALYVAKLIHQTIDLSLHHLGVPEIQRHRVLTRRRSGVEADTRPVTLLERLDDLSGDISCGAGNNGDAPSISISTHDLVGARRFHG